MPAWQILAIIIAFSVVYAALGVLWFYLIRRQVKAGPETGEPAAPEQAPAA